MQKKFNFCRLITRSFASKSLKSIIIISLFIFLFFYSNLFTVIYAENNDDMVDHYFSLSKIQSDFQISLNFNIFENILELNRKSTILKIYINKNIAIYNYKIFNSKVPIIKTYNNKIYILDYFIYKFYNSFFIASKNSDFYKNYFTNFNFKYDANIILGQEYENKNTLENNLIKTDKGSSGNIEVSDKNNNTTNLIGYAKKEIIEYRKIKYIILDPGHGGKDPGAIYNGIKEKDVNLYVAKKLQNYLSHRFPGLNVVMTRSEDKYISLEQRVKIANKYNTQNYTGLFISIHANASPFSKKANGLEIYYLDYNLVDEKIKNLVKYENKDIDNSTIGTIINRLLNEELIYESKKIASYIFQNYKKQKNPINAKSIYGAPFYVLAYTSIPSILIELGYLSNEKDAKNILSKYFLDSLFKAIEKGIKEYINEYNKTKGFKDIKK